MAKKKIDAIAIGAGLLAVGGAAGAAALGIGYAKAKASEAEAAAAIAAAEEAIAETTQSGKTDRAGLWSNLIGDLWGATLDFVGGASKAMVL